MADHDALPSRPQVTDPSDLDCHSWLNAAAVWWSQTLAEAGAGFRARLDADAKLPQPETPEQVDPELFTQHVIEDLDAVAHGYACFVRLGMSSYDEAYNSCQLYAWRRGSWGFSPEHLADLEDWIHARLSRWIETEG